MARDEAQDGADDGGGDARIAHLPPRGVLHAVPRDADDEAGEGAARATLAVLRQRHRDLDVAIEALQARGTDPFTVRRLKKRKLALRDRIAAIEDELTPDIIA